MKEEKNISLKKFIDEQGIVPEEELLTEDEMDNPDNIMIIEE